MAIRRRARSTAVGRRVRALQLAKEAKDKKEEEEKKKVAVETMPVVEKEKEKDPLSIPGARPDLIIYDDLTPEKKKEENTFNPLNSYVHPTMENLDRLLQEDGVPLDKLKDAFVHMNKEVLQQVELVEVMGAKEIGLVTKVAQRLLDIKIKEEAKKPKRGGKKKAPVKQTKEEIEAEFAEFL